MEEAGVKKGEHSFVSAMNEFLISRIDLAQLLDEIPKHKSTKTLYRSPIFKKVDLLEALRSSQEEEIMTESSKNNAKFLASKVTDFFSPHNRGANDWL
jgi:hypothetical protein